MTPGSTEHKTQFIHDLKKECAENIWKNELHLKRLDDELGVLRSELARLDTELDQKGKPAANSQKKQKFVLERNIEHKQKEVAELQETKTYNEYLLNDLIPRYEAS